jgi:hypothetical protein
VMIDLCFRLIINNYQVLLEGWIRNHFRNYTLLFQLVFNPI